MKRLGSMIVAVAVAAGLTAVTSLAQQPPTRKLIAPVRGEVPVEIMAPDTKFVGTDVVTTIRVKNVAAGPIAGFKVEENWYKGETPVGGDMYRHPRPFQAGETIDIVLTTPRKPIVGARNAYQFTHANGTIKPKTVPKLDAPPKPPTN
jgi:hypothetical protein